MYASPWTNSTPFDSNNFFIPEANLETVANILDFIRSYLICTVASIPFFLAEFVLLIISPKECKYLVGIQPR
jgi:hypothetical protein